MIPIIFMAVLLLCIIGSIYQAKKIHTYTDDDIGFLNQSHYTSFGDQDIAYIQHENGKLNINAPIQDPQWNEVEIHPEVQKVINAFTDNKPLVTSKQEKEPTFITYAQFLNLPIEQKQDWYYDDKKSQFGLVMELKEPPNKDLHYPRSMSFMQETIYEASMQEAGWHWNPLYKRWEKQ